MKYQDSFTITSHQVDPLNRLRPYMIMQLLQETADHQMRDRKPTYSQLYADGKSFIVSRFILEIYEDVPMYENVKVNTWYTPSRRKSITLNRSYELLWNDRIVAKAKGIWAIIDIESKKLLPPSSIDFSNYDKDDEAVLQLPERVKIPSNLQWEEVGTKKILYSDCDINLHFNNTYYGRLVTDFIPEPFKNRVRGLNIYFKKEAPMGSQISIFRAIGRNSEIYFRTFLGCDINSESIVYVE